MNLRSNNRKKTATNAKQRHQQDLRGPKEGGWGQELVDEEIAINLPLRAED